MEENDDEEGKRNMNPLSAEFNNRFLVDNVASRKTGGVSSSYVDNSVEFVTMHMTNAASPKPTPHLKSERHLVHKTPQMLSREEVAKFSKFKNLQQ